ncbi:hypothetical protein SpAn4DRAFT_2292 [Sporomusa ovata]|uniref:Uncharacterized protein n=1 Tax=Sporomusa ovata TaxID=2378 RepID=A0A0U1L061_9FIRM|nr:hypothetical protein SpAn4DRAFT_2292 [Sporomusa ovata]
MDFRNIARLFNFWTLGAYKKKQREVQFKARNFLKIFYIYKNRFCYKISLISKIERLVNKNADNWTIG